MANIPGTDGDDSLVGTPQSDRIRGRDGDDTIEGLGGNDNIRGDDGNDSIDGGAGNDSIRGGDGNDTIVGGSGNDDIRGQDGNDSLIAGDGNDNVSGGDGDDTLRGGGDNDNLRGDDGADTIIIDTLGTSGVNNTSVSGGAGGDDNDTLDISALLADGWIVANLVQNPENNGSPGFNGQIQLQRGNESANINFTDIETLVICFTPSTRIATERGLRRVDKLCVGDRVITRDNGLQPLRWIGRRDLTKAELKAAPHLRPVLIRKGALGHDMPDRDMRVSPNHRMLITSDAAEMTFGFPEVLIAAKHLTSLDEVEIIQPNRVSYIHLLFDAHEIILSDGTWSESFQPGAYTLRGVARATQREILELFPQLGTPEGQLGYRSARPALRAHEARVLLD